MFFFWVLFFVIYWCFSLSSFRVCVAVCVLGTSRFWVCVGFFVFFCLLLVLCVEVLFLCCVVGDCLGCLVLLVCWVLVLCLVLWLELKLREIDWVWCCWMMCCGLWCVWWCGFDVLIGVWWLVCVGGWCVWWCWVFCGVRASSVRTRRDARDERFVFVKCDGWIECVWCLI